MKSMTAIASTDLADDSSLKRRVDQLCTDTLLPIIRDWPEHDRTCRALIEALAKANLFGLALPKAYGGAGQLDRYSKILCLLRERFGYHDPLIDTHFAVQGLGTSAIVRMGTDDQHRRYLPGLTSGKTLFSFALTEPHSGSDVLGMKTRAHRDGSGWVLNGSKMFISGAPDADVYITFAKTGDEHDDRAITAFLIEAGTPGFTARGGIDLQAPHAIGYLDFDNCRVSDEQRLGEPGEGLRASLGTLEIFRPSVGSATVGMGKRAIDLALKVVRERHAFGAPLSALPGIQLKLGRMAAIVAGGAALVERAATMCDKGDRIMLEGAAAKAYATEAAIEVIHESQQIHGGRGVIVGYEIEALGRAVRPTTIYEGASEVQRTIIGRAEAKRARAGIPRGPEKLPDSDIGNLLREARATYEAWLDEAIKGPADKPAFQMRLAESAMALEAAEAVADGDNRDYLALAAARTLLGEIQRTGVAVQTEALDKAISACPMSEDDLALRIAGAMI